MPKLYVCSDIHGFFNEFKRALDDADFEPNNPEHLLIGCGDYMDRGSQPYETMQYLKSISNKVLCKGNHETLLLECLKRQEAWSHDIQNGTDKTIAILGKYYETRWTPTWYESCVVIEKPMQEWISNMVNYFETCNYIFCHGFIPCYTSGVKPWHKRNVIYSKRDDWRSATDSEWEDAMWINGMKACGIDNVYEEGKIIVVGHYHTSWGRKQFENKDELGENADFNPFYYKDKLIAIDACTAYSKKVNILVLEDELM